MSASMKLSEVFELAPKEGKYIDPVKLLQFLDVYAKLRVKEIAEPGLDPTSTELRRGQYLELCVLQTALEKELKNG